MAGGWLAERIAADLRVDASPRRAARSFQRPDWGFLSLAADSYERFHQMSAPLEVVTGSRVDESTWAK